MTSLRNLSDDAAYFDGLEIQRLRAEIERYERGLRQIKEYLDADRSGDASFTVEALLAR